MAKYEITHSCGHAKTYLIGGPVSGRERKAAWLASQPCPTCEHAEANAKAAEDAKALELPELRGSAKQIDWATAIRQDFLTAHARRGDIAVKLAAIPGDASWWIDNRLVLRLWTDMLFRINELAPERFATVIPKEERS